MRIFCPFKIRKQMQPVGFFYPRNRESPNFPYIMTRIFTQYACRDLGTWQMHNCIYRTRNRSAVCKGQQTPDSIAKNHYGNHSPSKHTHCIEMTYTVFRFREPAFKCPHSTGKSILSICHFLFEFCSYIVDQVTRTLQRLRPNSWPVDCVETLDKALPLFSQCTKLHTYCLQRDRFDTLITLFWTWAKDYLFTTKE